ncbi:MULTISPECIES: winged helix-turn-helix transcriptional regulator [unclassified Streptomyces]|uniref:winged helix-turn-helix transcriptional regulator n=1 Tax=unclassified Streptomyces TaxID=2593676 RepID=UPI00386727F6
MEVISGKWKVLILWALHQQHRRFGELRRHVPGVSEKVLIQQLRELEADGIVLREMYDEAPLRVEYSLRPRGEALFEALRPLGAWGRKHLVRVDVPDEIPVEVPVEVQV